MDFDGILFRWNSHCPSANGIAYERDRCVPLTLERNVQWPLNCFNWQCDFFLQGPDHPHCLSYKLELGSDQEIPSDWYPFATVQFGVPDTSASSTEVGSLGVESDVQPQKHVHQRACYNIQVRPKPLWLGLGLLELWPDLVLNICFALLRDHVCVWICVCMFVSFWPRKELAHGNLRVTGEPSLSPQF